MKLLTRIATLSGILAFCPIAFAQDVRPSPDLPRWDWGFQATTITQFAPSFHSLYEGPNSFLNEGLGETRDDLCPDAVPRGPSLGGRLGLDSTRVLRR